MFSYMNPSGTLSLRLPKEEVDKFLTKYNTTLFEAYGVVKKDYVTVPDSLLKKTRELQKYFEISYRFVETLKPNPSRKK